MKPWVHGLPSQGFTLGWVPPALQAAKFRWGTRSRGSSLTGSTSRVESIFVTHAPSFSIDREPSLSSDAAIPSAVHRPVLLDEVLDALEPRLGGVIIDGTTGAGGHTKALAERLKPGGRIIGLDRDPEMIALAEVATLSLPVTFIHSTYSDIDRVLHTLGLDGVDGILLDLGLSSDQLRWAHRGFSFQEDGPLDMRYDPRTIESAADMINNLSAEELADIFFDFGEERHSRRVARRIVESRRVEPILTTARLADIVRKSIPGKWGPIDPATRTFQALRIAVNGELAHLEVALANLSTWLNPGGRAAIISFHSLEDRRVKHAFRDDPHLEVLTRKPITATAEELQTNPRARSAKLRVAERCTNSTALSMAGQTRK